MIRKINSMHELQLEKVRLKMEIIKKEGDIKLNYRTILTAFSLRNIFSTVTNEISGTSIAGKLFTLGRNWLSNRKKKKKKKSEDGSRRAEDGGLKTEG